MSPILAPFAKDRAQLSTLFPLGKPRLPTRDGTERWSVVEVANSTSTIHLDGHPASHR